MDQACAEAGETLGGVTDWQEAAAIAMAAGSPLAGLPRGMRVRGSRSKRSEDEDVQPRDGNAKTHWKSQLPSGQELGVLLAFCALCAIMFTLIMLRPSAPQQDAHAGCRQCKQEWWQEFWSWRLHGLQTRTAHLEQAPPGMEWEWADSENDTDWFGVSAELVDQVVAQFADAADGPVLHVGCGDSPMPELLYKAGFTSSVHIDIAPQIISLLRQRYPPAQWPGMEFVVRDFLAPAEAGGGPPPPLHRFAAVIDKAGIWDWLQDEAPSELPRLMERVRDALRTGQRPGAYIIVTKQTPLELSDTLAQVRAEFTVEASRPLGSKGVAWSYVLGAALTAGVGLRDIR